MAGKRKPPGVGSKGGRFSRPLLVAVVLVAAAALCFMRRDDTGSEAVVPSSSDPPATQLLAHLKQKGALLAMVPATFAGGLRGMAADRNLKPGALVMQLPLSEMIYEGTVAPEVRQACAALPCNVSRAVLALGLAVERSLGEASRFYPFIKTLPNEVTNLVGWPGSLLLLMERAMPGTRSFLSREMNELEGANALLAAPVEVNTLLWAIAMVQSRAFGAWDGMEVLIPGADLMNHHWNPIETIPMPKCDIKTGQCHIFTAKRGFKPGQQLFFHYRPWSNLQLLIRYGFATPGNPWGPALPFAPLAKPPGWLIEAGCVAGPLQLRESQSAEAAPLSAESLRCARAAHMASSSESAALEAEQLWNSGAFNVSFTDKNGPGFQALVEIAEACNQKSNRWTEPEGLQLLAEVAELSWFIAADVVKSVTHDLQLLQSCAEIFGS